MTFKDHFSGHAALYSRYRPTYPEALFDFLAGVAPSRALALTLEWAALHRKELLEDWDLCVTKQTPKKIPPLP